MKSRAGAIVEDVGARGSRNGHCGKGPLTRQLAAINAIGSPTWLSLLLAYECRQNGLAAHARQLPSSNDQQEAFLHATVRATP